jgi:hypothetical protein
VLNRLEEGQAQGGEAALRIEILELPRLRGFVQQPGAADGPRSVAPLGGAPRN